MEENGKGSLPHLFVMIEVLASPPLPWSLAFISELTPAQIRAAYATIRPYLSQ